ncbi:variable surface protein [Plasmodium gonderi]|uniref:Variable surface protein n=1 Tax=Plasmodium gonderi TaxID=77519 RepID=A0A1Y1JPM3_PLAGO|nr:variable surface protein [Plasmodium gonderi]GAW84421.1 variable surface protein [Plasmodium gonderi]
MMAMKDYSFINKFHIYEKIMENIEIREDDPSNAKCKELYNVDSDNVKSIIIKKCPQAISYLKTINDKEKSEREIACNYFYYWIYHDILQEKKIINSYKLAIYLITVYRYLYRNKNIYEIYTSKFSNNDDLEKLNIIYDMYKNHDIIERSCLRKDKDIFCDIIKEKIDPYMKIFKINDIVAITEEVKTTCKSNVISPIIITFVVTSLISIFLFILIKFTSYGSYIRLGLESIKKKWNTLDELKILQNSDIPNRIKMNERYNILYNVE